VGELRPPRGLVACDLDGTLLRSDGTLSSRTVASIRAMQSAGWVFAMVTARPARQVGSIAAQAGLAGVALCSNGAVVFDLQSRTLVDGHPIDPVVASALVADLRQAVEGVCFAFELGLQFGRERAYPVRFHSSDEGALLGERIGDALELAASPVHKLIVARPQLDFDRLLAAVAATAGDRAQVTHSGREFVEVSARGVDKASGARLLAGRLGIDARDVIAIGDMPNDLPMLTWAGHAVAVANAHPDVIAVADRVVASNDEEGVAQLLETLA
jgi:hypothetical protein